VKTPQLLVLTAAFCVAAGAQVPYRATQGTATIIVMDWSNAFSNRLLGATGQIPLSSGIMLTVCTTDAATRVMHSATTYRAQDGSTQTRVDDLGMIGPDTGAGRCATTVVTVERQYIKSITVEQWARTSAPEFAIPLD
jgi:hypothetical protein